MLESVFTFLWCIRLPFDPTCVYFTSFILDVVFFLWIAPYGFGHAGWYKSWLTWIFQIAAIVALLMAIFAVIQIITKQSSASSRQATYVQCRMYTIIGLAIGGIILFVLGLTYRNDSSFNYKLQWAFEFGFPLLGTAAALHCYHENFA